MQRTTPAPILEPMSRKILRALCPLAALALVAPAAAAASAQRGSEASAGNGPGQSSNGSATTAQALSDGTLTVRSANGLLVLSGRGSVLGQVVGEAKVTIEDPDPSDGLPVVSGYDRAQRQGKFTVVYTGSDLRFRLLSGVFKLKIVASGISLSFVGRGTASLVPAGTLDDGGYSLDGGETYRALGFGATTNIVVGAITGVQPPASASGIVLETR